MTIKEYNALQPGDLITFRDICEAMAWLVTFGGWDYNLRTGDVIVVTDSVHHASCKSSIKVYVVHRNGAIGCGELPNHYPGLLASLEKIEN